MTPVRIHRHLLCRTVAAHLNHTRRLADGVARAMSERSAL